jgi:cupin superfamily acireductone dioxygenase involved in methionine salvage
VSILRTQLNSKSAEIETERLTKAREIESQAQENRDKMKDVHKQLEQMRTQLEFKVRCMLSLHSETKLI